jgi:signal transduction histidine kinase
MDPDRNSNPPPSIVPITERKPAVRLPPEVLDRLLVAVCEAEPGGDPERAVAAILNVATSFAPGASFGVRAPDPREGAAKPVLVVRRSAAPLGDARPEAGPLFPELPHESQFSIDFEPDGVLAVASDDPSPLPAGGVGPALVSRLALAVGAALRASRKSPEPPPPPRETPSMRPPAHKDKLAGLGKVVAGVVHELNNPVTSILAYADYLQRKAERGPLDASDVARIARIREAAERIHGFSRDLIAYARPSTEIPVPLLVHDVIDRALTFCEHVLEPSRITVERAYGDVLPVRAISGQLAQVFVNLFTNAAHAMRPHGGTLRVETALDDERSKVHVTVTDTGRGIAEEALARIFEPFFTTHEGQDKSGLGLSIVREIVEAHRGRVWAEHRPGQGAAFHVLLPVDVDED